MIGHPSKSETEIAKPARWPGRRPIRIGGLVGVFVFGGSLIVWSILKATLGVEAYPEFSGASVR